MKLREVLNSGYETIVIKDVDFELEQGNPSMYDFRFEYEAEPSDPQTFDSPGSPGGVSIVAAQARNDETNNEWVDVNLDPRKKVEFEKMIEHMLKTGDHGDDQDTQSDGEIDGGPRNYVPRRGGV